MFFYIVLTPISTTSGLWYLRVNTTKSTYTFTSLVLQASVATGAYRVIVLWLNILLNIHLSVRDPYCFASREFKHIAKTYENTQYISIVYIEQRS